MERYSNRFKNYLDDLAAKKPAPGGGSAVALSLCLGISLLQKAINYSSGENKKLKKCAYALRDLRKSISPYIDIDGDIFEKYIHSKGKMRLYFLKRSNAGIIKIGNTCNTVFSYAKRIESGIKESIISDFYIGLNFVAIALRGCIINLEVNSRTQGIDNIYIGKFKRRLSQWQKF